MFNYACLSPWPLFIFTFVPAAEVVKHFAETFTLLKNAG